MRLSWVCIALLAAGCGASLHEVATSERKWTGVAVAPDGRLFANYPRWFGGDHPSVVRVDPGAGVTPYPNTEWNTWSDGASPADHFVCVQSVHVDSAGTLWVLDPANPGFKGVVPGGPKLVAVDLADDTIARVIPFAPTTASGDSYLNDVRIDVSRQVAYLTDSGKGALVVLDLATGEARRVLQGADVTQSEGIDVVIGGTTWRRPDGSRPDVHADGIALPPPGDLLYFQALTGRTLYRVPTAALRDASLSPAALRSQVQVVARSGPADGLIADAQGRIYLSSLEEKAIRRVSPDGDVRTLVQDPRIRWPDSFAFGPHGDLYFTTAQIHLGPDPASPHAILRIPAKDLR